MSIPPHTVLGYSSMKPGVGKTTAAVLKAFQLALDGYRVGFVDGDRRSATTREWLAAVKQRSEKGSGTPLPFRYITAGHEQIVDAANTELPEHDIRIYDLQGGDDVMTRAVTQDATDMIICTTMSKFDRVKVVTARNSIRSGLMDHGREDEKLTPWVLFGRVKTQRALRQFSGGQEPSEEFEGYVANYLKNDLNVFGSWLPDRKVFEEVFKFHPQDKGLDMSPVRKIVAEMKEEGVIRA